MTVGPEENDAVKAMARALRRQASSADNRRDLARLPQFKVEVALPHRLASLLEEMKRIERRPC